MQYVTAPYGAMLRYTPDLEKLISFSDSPRLNTTQLWLEVPPGEPRKTTIDRLRTASAKLQSFSCIVQGCGATPVRGGRCLAHPLFPMLKRDCLFPGCGRAGAAGRGLCATHYAQARRGADLTPIRPRGRGHCTIRLVLHSDIVDQLGPDVAATIEGLIMAHLTPQKVSL